MASNPPTLVKARDGAACTCGCKGGDPWHKTHYRRVVRNRAVVRKVLPDGRIVVAEGSARFPWGVEPVRRIAWVLDGVECIVGWEIAK